MAGLAALIEALEGFEWDAGNSEKNWKRHQVTQAECEQIFANLPLLVSVATQTGSRLAGRLIGESKQDLPEHQWEWNDEFWKLEKTVIVNGDTGMVIEFNSRATILQGYTRDKADLRAALERDPSLTAAGELLSRLGK